MALFAAACTGDQSDRGTPGVVATQTTGGPLSTGVGKSGGASVDPPPHWNGAFSTTFGSFVLCSKQLGISIRLSKVTFADDAPAGIGAWVRKVGRGEATSAPVRDRARFIPFGFGLGGPPTFNQPYAGLRPSGKYTKDIGAVTVVEQCDDVSTAVSALNNGDAPRVGYSELMIVVPATDTGAEIDGFTIDYTAGGESYIARVPWTMVVCDRARTRSHCD